MAKKDPKSNVKDKGLYERLRGAGASKKTSARVANNTVTASRKVTGQVPVIGA